MSVTDCRLKPVKFQWNDTSIFVEKRGVEPTPWVIMRGLFALRRDAVWILEPSPSNRTQEHIESTRLTMFEVERLLSSLAALDRYPD